MIWFLLVLFIVSLAGNVACVWTIFHLAQKFGAHVEMSEDFAQQLVETSREYVDALDSVANKEIYINDPVIFRLVEDSKAYRDFLVNMTRIMLENREIASEPE